MFSTALLCVALPPPRGDEPNQADDWGGFGDALVSDAPEVLLGFCFAPNLVATPSCQDFLSKLHNMHQTAV